MKRTEISTLGKNAFVNQLTQPFDITHDDAATIEREGYLELVATATLLEGVDFDLQYTPLQHLGYKAVVAVLANIYAMNGTPEYMTVSLGLSARFAVEEVEAIYQGVGKGCEDYNVRLIGGNTSASLTGLTMAMTAIGRVETDKIAHRSGANSTDLLCITGNLGAAYMGLQLLEREKRAVGDSGIKPKLDGYNYLLQRQLKPTLPLTVIRGLAELSIVPTAMIDVTRGLASASLNLCQSSQCGVRIYLDRLPISSQTFAMAKELGADPVVAALNGGDDYEMLFTVPLSAHQDILTMAGVDVIGHIVSLSKGAAMTTPDGSEIALQSPDFTAKV